MPKMTPEQLEKWGQSNGCTGVPDFYVECCYEHDYHYRVGDIPRREADARLRKCIQSKSPFGKLSPLSWTRWVGTRLFGRFRHNPTGVK